MQHPTDEGQSDTMYGNTRYLDPTNDLAFKKLFGTDGHKDLLISFLNTMLRLEGNRQILQVKLLPQEMVPVVAGGKRSILDVSCVDATGTRYIVEMQNQHVPEFAKRVQMYASHAYMTQLDQGSSHLELSPVILLAVTNYTVFANKQNCISYHKVLDTKTFENDLRDISYVFVELSKFTKEAEEDLVTLEDKWLYFLKYWSELKCPPKNTTEPEILEAYATMERFNWSPLELEHYLKAQIATDEEQALQEEKMAEGYAKGSHEGYAKGSQEGYAKGNQEGYNKGQKQERIKAEREKVAIAQRLLDQGLDIQSIVNATGINAEFIAQRVKKAG